jgi:hypothetical protein
VTGQVPMRDGKPMTDGSIEDRKTFRDLTRFIRSTFPTNRQHGLPW